MLQRKYQAICGRTDKRGAVMPNLRFARRHTLMAASCDSELPHDIVHEHLSQYKIMSIKAARAQYSAQYFQQNQT
jgi:hypothetical protein